MELDILTLSTKGQVVIPSETRESLELSSGDKIVACCSNGTIFLKKLEMPKKESFKEAIKESIQFAKDVGMTEEDINKEIKKYRLEHKKRE